MSQLTERSFESDYHAPVMVAKVIAALDGAHSVLDCTLGGGGHSEALLENGATVVAIDRDRDAIAAATARLLPYAESGRFRAVLGDFTKIDDLFVIGAVSFGGILADLGVSSAQIDRDARGFSFRPGVVLDMRMSGDQDADATAADILNTSSMEELATIFHDFGDEPRARKLAREVVRRRATRQFAVADDVVGAIRGAFGASAGAPEFARLFQALRIAVNDELTGLRRALPMLRDILAPGGCMAIIAYHSGEDRIVKHAMREWSTSCTCPPRQPICTCGGIALGTMISRKSIQADAEEMAANPRARSARLRIWRKAA